MREQALPVREISRQALYRLPFYLSYLKKAEADGVLYISAPKVAADLNLNEVQVRKDIAKVSSCAGKPKIGYETAKLIKDLEKFLGYDNNNRCRCSRSRKSRQLAFTLRRIFRMRVSYSCGI